MSYVLLSHELNKLHASLTSALTTWTNVCNGYSSSYGKAADAVVTAAKGETTKYKDAGFEILTTLVPFLLPQVKILTAASTLLLAGVIEFQKGEPERDAANVDEFKVKHDSFAEDIKAMPSKLIGPAAQAAAKWMRSINVTDTMGRPAFDYHLSKILASPLWYPPEVVGVMQSRMEIAICADFLLSFKPKPSNAHMVRNIIQYIDKNSLARSSEIKDWEDLLPESSRGNFAGPGQVDYHKAADHAHFYLRHTRSIWEAKAKLASENGWLVPKPEIPKKERQTRSISINDLQNVGSEHIVITNGQVRKIHMTRPRRPSKLNPTWGYEYITYDDIPMFAKE